MTITKEKKKDIIKELRESITKQSGIFFVNFKGMKGESAYQFRSELQGVNAKMIVARKTLVKIAFEKEGIAFDPQSLEGEVGFVFGYENGIDTVKVVNKFVKEEAVTLLGGFFEGKLLTLEEAKSLAELPSREELMAKLLGTMAAPMRDFLCVLQGNTKGLLYVLANAKEKN